MPMLSKGKKKIDVMIINVHSHDLRSFQLLAQAVALATVSLIICDEHNEFLAKKALNDGAYLFLKKPLNEEIIKYLWQFVFREKTQREKARHRIEENGDWMNVGDVDFIDNNNIVGDEDQTGEKNIPNNEEQSSNIHKTENNVVANEKYKKRRKRGRKSTKEINEGESQINANNKAVRRKVCTKWTVDLHKKFAEAVQQLGEGRQEFSSGSQQRSNFKRFGIMPRLQTNISNLQQQQCNPDQTQRGLEFSFPTLNSNNIFAGGESSTQQQLYHPQLQVQSHYFNICNPFKNSFLSPQNSAGELQQQHGTLFGMLSSQGLQGTTIENINYRPVLAFNNGDHHNQNDYNLNLNAGLVTAYSGSAIMADTNIESATINELGAVNANCQQYIGDPNNIIVTSHASDTEESDSKETENCDAYFNFNNTSYLFHNLEPSSANLPNEHSSEFDQIYSTDQVSVSI
ncbi:hypothetical protein K7X08_023276 [Anisodus acutangulus]|uniref:Response regulatory domain-containing protein n=1 Tax=Anisodus acutangulus TaxID=402998 RepID=A0A9Q1LHU9_9SOLA|nr:hypothetical protein K7X08_023276 [Anisodus acutangulus]